MIKRIVSLFALSFILCIQLSAQHSVAREWNEVLLQAIRKDFARPTVHARNLLHTSIVMYDAWAVYDSASRTYLLGDTIGNFYTPFMGICPPANVQDAQEEAISYAAYRLLKYRFRSSPGRGISFPLMDSLFVNTLGYDSSFTSTNYATGSPAALGNYLAASMIAFGQQDGANEQNDYGNLFYTPLNPTLTPVTAGNPNMLDPNRWQPLTLNVFIDQSGNVIPLNTPEFLSPEWGEVVPFALEDSDLTVHTRNGNDYYVYHDPGPPALLDTANGGGLSDEYKWGNALVAIWSSHLDTTDTVMWDISPASIGNISQASYPTNIPDLRNFYNLLDGGDISPGHPLNPATGQPYTPQIVRRGDYGRVLAEFWADGPDSETPPGHWFTLLNYVNDHPLHTRNWGGTGPLLSPLEWDVKAYLAMGGAVHDAAISAWGIKGWYDYVRPISAIRYMADQGQCTDTTLSNYNKNGIPLEPGYIEVVDSNDALAGGGYQNVGKIKLYAWQGPDSIGNPLNTTAGVGWILAEHWWPYQRPSFVTPPFAGYVSGHSTYSRAAAEVMTLMTGDAYFPGGMGEFLAAKNQFLVFEDGPSEDIVLQWATYRDASDQCSLSRIWGGIHPPVDDMPGRLIGIEIGTDAFNFAENYFYVPKPALTSIVASPSVITDSDAGSATFSISLQYDQDMDTTVMPVLNFTTDDPSATIILNTAATGWTGLRDFTFYYDAVDSDTLLTNLDFCIRGGKSLAQTFQFPLDTGSVFIIDTRNPEVTELIANPSLITDVDAGTAGFSLTANFVEAMDTTVMPLFSFPVEDPLANTLTLNLTNSGWISEFQYEAIYDVTDANEVLSNIDVRITGGTDAGGNDMVTFDSLDAFSIEMENPSVISLLPDPLLLTDSEVGAGNFTITAVYSEMMDTTAIPTVTFPVEDPLARTLTPAASGWTSLTEFVATYDVADSNEALPNIDVQINGAIDFVGNPQQVGSAVDTFSIKTDNPTIVALQTQPGTIADADVGTNTFTLTVDFSRAMDTTSPPAIVFPVEDPLANTLIVNPGGTGWTSPTQYVASYDVVDDNETLMDIDVEVSGVADPIGNTLQLYTEPDKFSIDTENPLVTSAWGNPGLVYDFFIGVNGFGLDLIFSEVMDTTVDPVITFPVEDPLAQTLTRNPDTTFGGWVNPTRFIASYNVFDAQEVLEDIDVRVEMGKDQVGNHMVIADSPDLFDIEMKNPSVVRVIPSPSVVTANDTGLGTFSLTLIFDEDMSPFNLPVIDWSVENPSPWLTLNSGSGSWLNATTYEAVYDVAYVADTLLDIDLEVTGAADVPGNELVFYAEPDNFDIRMQAMVGIAAGQLNGVEVYPNPSTGAVYLNFAQGYSSDLSIRAFDALGVARDLPVTMLGSERIRLDMSKLASGSYYLVVRDGDGVLTTKIRLSK